MNNLLYLIISQGMKVISQIEENSFDNTFSNFEVKYKKIDFYFKK